MKNTGFLFLVVAVLISGCQSAPKKKPMPQKRDPLIGRYVDAMCAFGEFPFAQPGSIFLGSKNGYYLLRNEDGVITLPVSSCMLQFYDEDLETPEKSNLSI
mgnify:CR=1 FL=1